MNRRYHDEAKAPPQGEYAVFYERPFPKRLDRFFRLAAIVAAPLAALAAVGWLLLITTSNDPNKLALALLSLVAAVMAWGAVRAVGMIVTSLYGFTRRKQYVLDWHEPPPDGR